MMKWLGTIRCKEFARHIATGEDPDKGFGQRLQYAYHWLICPFCKHYWREIKALGYLHNENSRIAHHPAIEMDRVKHRLQEQLKKHFAA